MCYHNKTVLGKSRKNSKKAITEALDNLADQYNSLIFDHALNPEIIESFNDRRSYARDMGRDMEVFLKEEEEAFRVLEKKALAKSHKAAMQEEARRRRLAGETFADKVIGEYRQKIEHYPALNIHPDADYEISRLYGAMEFLDKNHWTPLLLFLRKAFPGAGQLDRMTMEQRFWRFVSTRPGRMPEELEPYYRALSAPSATEKDRVREAQETIKKAAFFLHDFLDLCERARNKRPPSEEVERAISYIQSIISDFRIKELKRR